MVTQQENHLPSDPAKGHGWDLHHCRRQHTHTHTHTQTPPFYYLFKFSQQEEMAYKTIPLDHKQVNG